MQRVGIIGTGFVARGAYRSLLAMEGVEVSKVLTRRDGSGIEEIASDDLTRSVSELIDESDLVFEASGDAIHATDVLDGVARAGLPIVTMDSEFQVTTGSHFVDRAYLTEADGDQPGCQARLKLEAEQMGFRPLAYMNIKGFLNLDPSPVDMEHWARVQGLRLDQVVSFTDGSKLQIEQALVANGLGAELVRDGMTGRSVADLRETGELGRIAEERGRPVSDFVLSSSSPPGVFLLADHDEIGRHDQYGPYAKLRTTEGGYCVLVRPYHLIHLEVPLTLAGIFRGDPPLLNNGPDPRVGVAAIAKVPLKRGQEIARGLGSFQVRGVAVNYRDHPDHVPICLLRNAVLRRDVEPGSPIEFDHVELPETLALTICGELRQRILTHADDSPAGRLRSIANLEDPSLDRILVAESSNI